MNTTNDFLDAVKAKTGAASDYRLAKNLEISTSRIANYRSGYSKLDDEIAMKVARILEIDAGIVLAAVHSERAKSDAEKAVWKSVFEKLGGIAAAVVVGIMLNSPHTAEASTGAALVVGSTSDLSIHYTK